MLSRVVHRVIRAFPPWYHLRARALVALLDGSVDPELRYLARYLPAERRRVALDVGANNGVTACILSRMFDKVHAFEPNSQLLEQWRNLAPSNVTVWDVALSDSSGETVLLVPVVGKQLLPGWASLDRPAIGAPQDFVRLPARRATLDSLGLADEPVDFVKIDVEGHEISVLNGARQLFERQRPWVVIEVWDQHRQAVLEWFFDLAYEPVDLAAEMRINKSPQNLILRPKST